MSAFACRVCRATAAGPVLDLGPQPVTKNLLPAGATSEPRHPLRVTQCLGCGAVQMVEPFPYAMLVPPDVGALSREPEAHLDDAVARLSRRWAAVGAAPSLLALSLKDKTTLDRLAALGFALARTVDPMADLGATDPAANIETIQKLFTPDAARRIVARYGQADCVIVRHVLEHAEAPLEFLEAVKICLKPDGFVFCEVPDCGAGMRARDYPIIWEEHVVYFTPSTLRALFAAVGFRGVEMQSYPYAFEDSLVLTAGVAGPPGPPAPIDIAEIAAFSALVSGFTDIKTQVRAAIDAARRKGPAFIYGAGHLAASFVNYFGLEGAFAGALDDSPQKHGRRLAGSLLEILSPRDARVKDMALCVLAVTPDLETRVAENVTQEFGARVAVKSAFMRSPRSLVRPGPL